MWSKSIVSSHLMPNNSKLIWYLQSVKGCLSTFKWFKRVLIWSWWAVAPAVNKRAQWWWSNLQINRQAIIVWVVLKKTEHLTVVVSSRLGIHLQTLREEEAIDAMDLLSLLQILQMLEVNLSYHYLPQIVVRQTRVLQLVLTKRILPQMVVIFMEPMEVPHFKQNSKILKLVNNSKLE